MPVLPSRRPGGNSLWRAGASYPLNRAEQITLFALVGAGVLISAIFVFGPDSNELASSVFQLVLTATFALFAWSPTLAVLSLLACMTASFYVDDVSATLVALAIATGCVVRTGSGSLLAIYTSGFLLSGATAAVLSKPPIALSSLAAALLIATVSGAVGYLLRAVSARERRLRQRLRAQEDAEREATYAERQRIADELHDVIAHDLTVIMMHSNVLEQPIDTETRQQSQEAIREAARKSLGDLRRVVEQASGPALLTEAPLETLKEALDSARTGLLGIGNTLVVKGDVQDLLVPRLIDAALARIVRESITNVLKHGGRGCVEVVLQTSASTVTLMITNPLNNRGRRGELPSGGYGITRMNARARQLGGSLDAGVRNGLWATEVSLPLE